VSSKQTGRLVFFWRTVARSTIRLLHADAVVADCTRWLLEIHAPLLRRIVQDEGMLVGQKGSPRPIVVGAAERFSMQSQLCGAASVTAHQFSTLKHYTVPSDGRLARGPARYKVT
jgi:hypothetical protein